MVDTCHRACSASLTAVTRLDQPLPLAYRRRSPAADLMVSYAACFAAFAATTTMSARVAMSRRRSLPRGCCPPTLVPPPGLVGRLGPLGCGLNEAVQQHRPALQIGERLFGGLRLGRGAEYRQRLAQPSAFFEQFGEFQPHLGLDQGPCASASGMSGPTRRPTASARAPLLGAGSYMTARTTSTTHLASRGGADSSRKTRSQRFVSTHSHPHRDRLATVPPRGRPVRLGLPSPARRLRRSRT